MHNNQDKLKILYELSMAIGTSLSLKSMLKEFATTLLSKISASAIIILEEENDILKNIYSNPKTIINNKYYFDILEEASRNKNNIFIKRFEENKICHILDMENFGKLIILRKDEIDIDILNAFKPIVKKLVTSIKACYNHNLLTEQKQQLTQSLQKEKELQKEKDQFLANMSHEIRTPLNAIIGFINVLKETPLNSEQNKYLEIINTSSELLLAIINDILDFSKLVAGKVDLFIEQNDLKKELENTLENFKLQAKNKCLDFEISIDDKISNILYFDSIKLKQIVFNLVGNAIKFTNQGKVSFLCEVLNEDEESQNIRFSIKDTGIGIQSDKLEIIFNPFIQSDSSTTKQFGGTGLGLAISKSIIELQNGILEVQSKENEGSVFSFELRLKKGEEIISKPSQEIKELIQKEKKHFLVAEDNQMNQMIIEVILQKMGHELTIAQNGLEAVELYKKNYMIYDMVLMDISMPLLNGEEATKQIIDFEKQNNISHTSIVALTANAFEDDRIKYLESGMDYYLSKPISLDKLMEIIK